MPFTFAQPIDLGGLPPLPAQPVKEGPKAPPLTPPRHVSVPHSVNNAYVVRREAKQWRLDEARAELKKYLQPSDKPSDLPDETLTGAIADALFRENREGTLWSIIQRGIPVYRAQMEAVLVSILEQANQFGQHFDIPGTTLEQYRQDRAS